MKKIKLTDPLPQWQNPIQSTGRKESYRTGSTANLTNLRENYNNKIQNIGDILRERYKIPEDQSKVAILTPSSNTVSNAEKAEDRQVDVVEKTTEIQPDSTGTTASTIDTVITGN
jgi:hypothetical protein